MGSNRPEQQPEQRPDARGRLRAAAAEAFAARGFNATTTRDIATAAGMSPAALYAYYDTKEQLLHELSRSGHEKTLTLVEEAIAGDDSPTARLRRLIRAFAIHHARGHTSARVVNYELSALTPEHRTEILDLRHAIEKHVRDLVAAGVDAGEFDVPHQHLTAAALLSLGIDIARWYREGGSWSPEHVGDAYAEIALRIVGARPGG